ncbi:hypothetical protein C8J56DRAFT_172696 [Mycena floridula]|nr:hypothetical protein C8J56DRAFT_172696 [Mycena floridula]
MSLGRFTYGLFAKNLRFGHLRCLHDAPDASLSQLSTVISRNKDIQEADRIRLTMRDMGLKIPPSLVYRTAATLVLQRPDYLDHAAAFEAWLSLCPEAEDPDQLHFPRIPTMLLANPRVNLPLLHIFGRKSAQKGYIRLVRQRIIPALQRFGNAEMIQQIEDDIAAFQDNTPHDATVEPLTETTCPASLSPTTPPSPVPFSLIENALPALLPEASENDGSIFEDDTFYDYPDSYPKPMSHSTPITRLSDLITDGDYEEARRLLKELLDTGATIPPSFIYEKAAQYTIGLPYNSQGDSLHLDYAQRLSDFTMWFSLIPDIEVTEPHDFSTTHRLLFGSIITQLDVIIRFGLICASKGYSDFVSSPVFSAITQYADPETSLQFLETYERNMEQFWIRTSKYLLSNRSWAFVRGLAIRGLARAGHIDQALSILPDETSTKYVSLDTYQIVLDRLDQGGKKYFGAAKRVKTLRDAHVNAYITKPTLISNILASAEAGPPSDDPPLDEGLGATLRYLKRALRGIEYEKQARRGRERLPRALTIMNFMMKYIDLGRWKALGLLRKLAFRQGYNAASKYLFAELLCLYHRGDHRSVIRGFVDSFYLTGVPRTEVLIALGHQKHQIGAVRGEWDIPRGKIFPGPLHCSIVWHSLVALSPSQVHLEMLYQKLLDFAQGRATEQLPRMLSAYAGVSPLIPPPAWINKVSPSSFTPFMRPLMHHSGSSRGTRIIRDMLVLGLTPNIYQYTELAGFYAYKGDTAKAMYILSRLEAVDSELTTPTDSNDNRDSGDLKDEEIRVGQATELTLDEQSLIDEPGETVAAREPVETAAVEEPTETFAAEELGEKVAAEEPAVAVAVPSSADIPAVSPDEMKTESPVVENSDPEPVSTPPANFVLYVSLMRNFLTSGDLDAVKQVNDRLRQKYKEYIPGQNEHLDNVYEDWKHMEQRKRKKKSSR